MLNRGKRRGTPSAQRSNADQGWPTVFHVFFALHFVDIRRDPTTIKIAGRLES